MDLYADFFDETKGEEPYEGEEEFAQELWTAVDACLYAACGVRELWGQRLDMRGVVITPQEFETALLDRSPSVRAEAVRRKEEVQPKLSQIDRHIRGRLSRSRTAGMDIDRFRLIRAGAVCGLNALEWFCYILAVAPEWDRKYERLYGYVQDNVGAKLPSVGLACGLFSLLGQGPAACPGSGSPLWTYLLEPMRWGKEAEESDLSGPMKLRGPIIDWLKGGVLFDGPWRWLAHMQGADLVLAVSAVVRYGKEYSQTIEMVMGTFLWAKMVAGADTEPQTGGMILTECGEAAEEETKRIEAVLELHGLPFQRQEGKAGRLAGGTAVSVPLVFSWGDLVLEPTAQLLLRQLCDKVKYRDLVQNQWGFAAKSPYGTGASALFYGPPGTGKTMAAQVVAKELGLRLYKVDLSSLMSKYIGETEKNLNRLFQAASRENCVLFFDEADGLFAKRSQVSGSNDRYANMETGYLLQKFEEYEGICILATNCLYNLDDAFKRRISCIVRFAFPSEETRFKLWNSMFPAGARIDEPLEFQRYARQFELSGSAIKEVVINAAYLAAARGTGIQKADIRSALKGYYLKYGKAMTERELE